MTQKIDTTNPLNGGGTIALIDAFSLFFKAFFAIRGLSNAQGLPTNAVYGFIRMLQKLLKDYHPEYIAIALESPTVTFRTELHEDYKANRPEPPSDLVQQIPWLKKACNAWGLSTIEYNGYEADDVIGTMARMAEAKGLNVWIVSADKDLFQLVTEQTKFLRFEGNEIEIYDPAKVSEKMGVLPSQIVDYLALVGDSSDNIPGVPKIGPKSAVELLREFGSLDTLLENPEAIKNARWRDLIKSGADSARLSRRLACICETIPLEVDWTTLMWHGKLSTPAFTEVCRELGFKTLVQQGELEARQEAAALDFFDAGEVIVPAKPAATRYSLIQDESQLQALVRRIQSAPMLAIDTETVPSDFFLGDLVGLSLSIEPGEAFYVPVGHRMLGDSGRQLTIETVRKHLGGVLKDPAVAKVGHNLKDDLKILEACGLPIVGIVFDTAIAQYLLDADSEISMEKMAKRILAMEQRPIAELIGTGKAQLAFSDVAMESACDYACQDADIALRLAEHLSRELDKAELSQVMRDIELPLVHVLADMEMEGVRLDVEYLRDLSNRTKTKLHDLREQIFSISGKSFNINSTKQVADLLFNELGLKPTKSGKAGFSTDVTVLESLADKHPLPKLLMEYRGYDKLLTTYIDPLPEMVNPQTGRLHCLFSQTIAATGRLSCSSPNLQNIPVRTEEGKAIRKAFLPNREGEVLLAADYSQIELRVLAHLSQDEGLISAFQRDIDIHLDTASRIFRVEPSSVTSLMRSQAKVVNFGVLYGMSAMRLSNEFKISRQAAQKFIDEYFAAYPKVGEWIEMIVQSGRRDGFVRTLSGRKRLLPGLNASSAAVRRATERITVNTPVQGSAADMIKLAMIRIAERLKKSHLGGRMLLQIHDELIFTTPQGEVDELQELVRYEMENALPLDVPVKVNVCVGANWTEV